MIISAKIIYQWNIFLKICAVVISMVRAILFQEGSSFGAKYGLVLLLSELWRHLMVSCPALTLPCQGHSKLSGICPVDSYLPKSTTYNLLNILPIIY